MAQESTRIAEDEGLRECYAEVPRAPVKLLCSAMNKAVNHGGLLRLAEAYRLEEVIYELEEERVRDFSGVRGAHVWQRWSWSADITITAQQLKEEGYVLYGLSLNGSATPVQSTKWEFPCAIVLGEELKGLRPEVEAICDHIVAIPLYGITISLNVGMAAAIAVDSAITACHHKSGFMPVRRASLDLLKSNH